MKRNLKFLIIIVTLVVISAIIVINLRNKKIVICIDARSWRNRCWSNTRRKI